ncbi:MAG: hypothetical protein PVI50_03765 [Gammaproteobacteria bacterium]
MLPRLPASVLLLTLAGLLQAGQGEDAAIADESFLLFLADWENARGGWQDPLEFDGPGWAETDYRQVQDDDTTDPAH